MALAGGGGMLRRRDVVGLMAGAAACPLGVAAQPSGRMPVIGVLMATPRTSGLHASHHAAFQKGLEDHGWVDGRNCRVEYRSAAGEAGGAAAAAKALLALKPDVIVGESTPGVRALRAETSTTPIVFVQVFDPLGLGLVESFARPGGNITGLASFDTRLGQKWLQLLKELAPTIGHAGVLFNPVSATYFPMIFDAITTVARDYPVEVDPTPVRTAAEIEQTFAALAQRPGAGVIVAPDIFTLTVNTLIIALAAKYRLPAMYPYRNFVEQGGLIAYGLDPTASYRDAGGYVDSILKGARPADLPVQPPTSFELIVNLATARALGLTVPRTLLVRANMVIE
jgi:putative ABC transport system substrate-binding protein